MLASTNKVLIVLSVLVLFMIGYIVYTLSGAIKRAEVSPTSQRCEEQGTTGDSSSLQSIKNVKWDSYNVYIREKDVRVFRCSGVHFTVFEYDSCEYIMAGQGLCHKGNCKYCAARAKK